MELNESKTVRVIVILLIWVSISSLIQAFTCPKMTETERLIHIPKAFIGQWECIHKEK